MTLEERNAKIAELEKKIAEIDKALANPNRSNDLQISKYEKAADAIAEYDPEMAMQWLGKADQIRQNAELMGLNRYKAENNMSNSQAYKIQSAINSASNLQSSYVNNKQFDKAKQLDGLIGAFKKEMQSQSPDILNAYRSVNASPELQKEIENGADVEVEPDVGQTGQTGQSFDFDTWVDGYINKLWESPPEQNKDGTLKKPSTLRRQMKNALKALNVDADTYRVSIDEAISDFNTELKDIVSAERGETEFNLNKASKSEDLNQTKYDNYIKTYLPNITSAFNDLEKIRNGFVSAISQAKRSPAGGAYIAMKKVLGDALSGADFAGIAGFGIDAGIIAKLKSLFGANPLTDSEAKNIIRQAIDGFNGMVANYKQKFDTTNDYGSKASKAYGINTLPMPTFDGTGTGTGTGTKTSRELLREKMLRRGKK